MNQLSFFDDRSSSTPKGPLGFESQRLSGVHRSSSGSDLRDKGIRRAAQHADETEPGWSTMALDFLYLFAREHSRFSGEMVRIESKKYKIPEPPSLRAWGAVLVKAANCGWIKQVGFIHVDNPKAHRANAALWQSNLCNRIPESLESAER